MVYVTGDVHGEIKRFKSKRVKRMKKRDYLIICGDFSFIWNGSKKEKKLLKWIGKRKFTTLFVDGTHENYDLLEEYPRESFCEGEARRISKRLWGLCRGEIYNLNGQKFFVFGGGESRNYDDKIKENCFWNREMPNEEEYENGLKNLAEHDFSVDYIITHEAPFAIKEVVDPEDDTQNELHFYFNDIAKRVEFRRWYFGFFHINKVIPRSYQAVYTDVVPVILPIFEKTCKKR